MEPVSEPPLVCASVKFVTVTGSQVCTLPHPSGHRRRQANSRLGKQVETFTQICREIDTRSNRSKACNVQEDRAKIWFIHTADLIDLYSIMYMDAAGW